MCRSTTGSLAATGEYIHRSIVLKTLESFTCRKKIFNRYRYDKNHEDRTFLAIMSILSGGKDSRSSSLIGRELLA